MVWSTQWIYLPKTVGQFKKTLKQEEYIYYIGTTYTKKFTYFFLGIIFLSSTGTLFVTL